MAYITETPDYFSYLHEADDDAAFEAASQKNLHDLFVLARYGLIHPDIIELFHDYMHNDHRWDVGKYLCLIDVVKPISMDRASGSGMLQGWEGMIRYPNLRLSGPADFAEMVSLDELISLKHPHSI